MGKKKDDGSSKVAVKTAGRVAKPKAGVRRGSRKATSEVPGHKLEKPRQKKKLLSNGLECPECGHFRRLKPNMLDGKQTSIICPNCRTKYLAKRIFEITACS